MGGGWSVALAGGYPALPINVGFITMGVDVIRLTFDNVQSQMYSNLWVLVWYTCCVSRGQ